MQCWKIIVSGRVQGVGFRRSVQDFVHANMPFFHGSTGITGSVKNLNDGRVEIIAEGVEADLSKLAEFARVGSDFAQVEKIIIDKEQVEGHSFKDFSVVY